MQTLLAQKTVSMTELREPAKVLQQAGNQPVAIMNRNQVVAYFVPISAIQTSSLETASSDEVKAALTKRYTTLEPTLKYLEDK